MVTCMVDKLPGWAAAYKKVILLQLLYRELNSVVDPLPTLTVTCPSRELIIETHVHCILSQFIKVIVANRLFASPSYTTSGDPDS